MKRKKLVVLLLTIVFTMSLFPMSVFAANTVAAGSTASITVENAVENDVLAAYKVVDITYNETNNNLTYAWNTASIGMMDASLAAKIMYADEVSKAEDVQVLIAEKAAEYANLQSSVESAAARGCVDTIINPEDTRKYVAAAFEMLYTKREDRPDKKHGTV